MRLPSAALAALALLAAPAAASAGTIAIRTETGAGGTTFRVAEYVAAAGEANRLAFVHSAGLLRVTDTGATVVAGAGCTSVSATVATCPATTYTNVRVWAGDRNDVVRGVTWQCSNSVLCPVNQLIGGQGNDLLIGSDENHDRLFGGPGKDRLRGHGQYDVLAGGPGADVFRGGAGFDEVVYWGRKNGVSADLDGVADDGEVGELDLIGKDVEYLTGGDGDDTLTGDAGQNDLTGGPGSDVLRGRGGFDVITGESGDDTLSGGSERLGDLIVAGDGNDRVFGGGGNDVLEGGFGDDRIFGGPGRDGLRGLAGNDVMRGGGGSDSIAGFQGADTMYSRDDARDVVHGGAGEDAAQVDSLDRVRRVERLF